MFVIQTNNGSIIEKDPYIDPNLCNFEQRLTERLDKSLV